ncbi:hypothetical protein GLYMA_11G074850v4 [Glycine max]|nr:hypothetical protein GLYMA_11G074850v4 [Glycine max]KAG4987983.1 hypothetical protein JHK85_030966 [Glycine max]KAH1158039.1 hypothetical protein GYH30_030329 [Glycine max]KHN41917.1 hypothetical protein glysoja_003657 [Glycine soja]
MMMNDENIHKNACHRGGDFTNSGVTMLFGFGGFLQMTHFLCPKLVSYFKSHVNPMIPPSKRISGSTIGTNLLSCKIMVALSASTNTSK